VEDYLPSIDSLPLQLKRKVSVMKEIEAKCQEILKELDEHYEKLKKRDRLCSKMPSAALHPELGNEKIQILSQMEELAESQTREVDSHVEQFEAPHETKDTTGNSCKAGQEKTKNKTVAQAEKLNYKHTLWPLNNVNQSDEYI
ncbi:Inhibitor of growth protein 1, partial [Sciurus carolinensis]|nr:Inhibitor of growth protein 1 [Sciurus carolinensis]